MSLYPKTPTTEERYEYRCCDGQYYIILTHDTDYPDQLQIRLERFNAFYNTYISLFTLSVPDLRTDCPPEIIAEKIEDLWGTEKYKLFTTALRNAIMQ